MTIQELNQKLDYISDSLDSTRICVDGVGAVPNNIESLVSQLYSTSNKLAELCNVYESMNETLIPAIEETEIDKYDLDDDYEESIIPVIDATSSFGDSSSYKTHIIGEDIEEDGLDYEDELFNDVKFEIKKELIKQLKDNNLHFTTPKDIGEDEYTTLSAWGEVAKIDDMIRVIYNTGKAKRIDSIPEMVSIWITNVNNNSRMLTSDIITEDNLPIGAAIGIDELSEDDYWNMIDAGYDPDNEDDIEQYYTSLDY